MAHQELCILLEEERHGKISNLPCLPCIIQLEMDKKGSIHEKELSIPLIDLLYLVTISFHLLQCV